MNGKTLMDKRKQEPFWLVTDGRRYEQPPRLGLLAAIVGAVLVSGAVLWVWRVVLQGIRP